MIRRNRRRVWICCLLAAAVSAAVMISTVCYISFLDYKTSDQASADIFPDRNAVNGVRNAGEGEPVDEGDYWIILNQLPTMEAGSRECNIQFENPQENHYRARLELYLKSTGEQIGETGMVDTGMYVDTIRLEQILDPGEYPVQAKIELFNGTEPAGDMMLEITLRVTENENKN